MNLSTEELSRYSRHLRLKEVGEEGQEKLKNAKVLVIGAGGLGCPILQYLAAAGVGELGIIDFDEVEESNLQRQVLFGTSDIGTNKAVAAKNRLESLNPLITITTYPYKLTTKNALELFASYDIIVDGSDNFSTRYLVNDAAIICGKPLVYGAIHRFEGQVSVFNYEEGPSYRCLFPNPPKAGSVPNCSEIGVLGILPGIIGSMQATEALKLILGIGKPLSGRLLVYNALNHQQLLLQISKNVEVIEQTKQSVDDFEDMNYDVFCGIEPIDTDNIQEITAEELANKLQTQSVQLVDVRESFEQPKLTKYPVISIPVKEILTKASNIDKTLETVIFCQHGIRSQHAIELLQEHFGFKNLSNLKGGIIKLHRLLKVM
ncbi:MAG: HesA/MoeB/ThiF family protein [Aureispira sp.]|nr:HesA/MoeB/ThiF family protein [Aureispira sp.]